MDYKIRYMRNTLYRVNQRYTKAAHLLFPQYMDESTERELALFMGMVLLGKCAQVWVFGDVISDGMAAEIAKAKKKGKVIRYFTEDLEEKVK